MGKRGRDRRVHKGVSEKGVHKGVNEREVRKGVRESSVDEKGVRMGLSRLHQGDSDERGLY